MPSITRQQKIAELINAEGEKSVHELVERFGVTGVTIRRELQVLADRGLIIRTHGGGAPGRQVMFAFQFLERTRTHWPAKQQIARCASEIVRECQSVLLDSGTTTLAMAEWLRMRKNISVMTTSLPIAAALQHAPNVEVLVIGGWLRQGVPDLVGELTEDVLENLYADIAFVGADAIDTRGNLYNVAMNVGRTVQKMIGAARNVYVVADSSKIGKRALMRFGNVARLDGLVTDNGIARSDATALRRAGVNLLIAPKSGWS